MEYITELESKDFIGFLNRVVKNRYDSRSCIICDELGNYLLEYNDDMGYYDVTYSNPLEMVPNDKEEAFRLGCYSDFNWSDDIFFFDGYGNIKSCPSWGSYFNQYVDIEQFAEWFIENYPDEALELFSENEHFFR